MKKKKDLKWVFKSLDFKMPAQPTQTQTKSIFCWARWLSEQEQDSSEAKQTTSSTISYANLQGRLLGDTQLNHKAGLFMCLQVLHLK